MTMRNENSRTAKGQRGYSLVELSLVLVVIGLILGAASVGKDLQRNAEYKKIKQRFVDQWVQAYGEYFDRIGVVVGDNTLLPTGVVGSLDMAAGVQTVLQAGNFAAVTQAQATVLCSTRSGTTSTGAGTGDLREYFEDAGIELPSGRTALREDMYLYLDSNGNPQQLKVCFRWLIPGSDVGSGNVMLISGLTPDLAKALDAAIDGRADGTTGRFRRSRLAVDSANIANPVNNPATDWPTGNDSDDMLGDAAAAAPGASAVDENDQVQTLVAVYKMVQ